jgi:hypothetical protein
LTIPFAFIPYSALPHLLHTIDPSPTYLPTISSISPHHQVSFSDPKVKEKRAVINFLVEKDRIFGPDGVGAVFDGRLANDHLFPPCQYHVAEVLADIQAVPISIFMATTLGVTRLPKSSTFPRIRLEEDP